MRYRRSTFVLKAAALFSPCILYSLPEMSEVIAGGAQISHPTAQSLVVEVSDKTIINYKAFDIQAGESVRFVQPESSSYVLNRVIGEDPSKIAGSLSSNGVLFLVNPNGVYFGPSSSVNVGSLITSTLDIANEDFLAGKFRFTLQKGSEKAEIVNEGSIHASNEGSILLLAPYIKNKGSLSVQVGKVALLSGETVTVDFTGDRLMSFSVEGELENAVIEHLGTIRAEDGTAFLRMKTADRVIQHVLNTDGVQEGMRIRKENGVVFLAAQSDIIAKEISIDAPGVEIEGKVDASTSTMGGTIHLLGDSVILRGATVLASGEHGGGTILIGGDYQGKGEVRNSAHVSCDQESLIQADAISHGSGGKVILWADQLERFDGKIQARGVDKGGFVETSCDGPMSIRGHVDTSSVSGLYGEWLIDPTSITVIIGGTATLAASENCSVGAGLLIDPITIAAAITNVTLCTTGGTPTVTVTDAISIPTANLGITIQTVGGTPVINLNNNISTNSGNINFNGNVTLGGSLTSLVTNSSGNGASVTFTGTINGARPLTVTSGTGSLAVAGVIGGTTPLTSMTVTANGGISLAGIGGVGPGVIGAVDLTSSGGLTLAGGTYNAASHTYTGNVSISANTTITSAASAVAITGSINSSGIGRTLSVGSTGGAITIAGSMGTSQALGGLTLNAGAGAISVGSVGSSLVAGSTTGFTFTSTAVGTGITLNGGNYNSSGGTQSYAGNVVLGGSTSLISNNSAISFTGTINGLSISGQDLVLAAGLGSITCTGAIGGLTRLGLINILTANGVTTDGITASAFREMNPTGTNTLGTINTNAIGGIFLNGAGITLSGPITTTGSGFFEIINTGVLTLPAAAPVTIDRALMQTGGGTVLLGANITTAGDTINFAGATTLTGAGPVVLSTGVDIGDIIFGSTINGAVALSATTVLGQVRVTGAIGTTTPLTTLTLNAGSGINLGSIGTVGVAGAGVTTLTTSGEIGLNGAIYHATSHTYTGNTRLQNNVTIQSVTNNNILITGPIDSDGVMTRNLSINTGAIGSTGTVTLTSAIGTGFALGSLSVDARAGTLAISSVGAGVTAGATSGMTLAGTGGITLNGGQYVTSGGTQLYSNNTIITASTIFNTLNSGLTFTGSLNGVVAGAQPTGINVGSGALSFVGAVGDTIRLGAITINSASSVTASSTVNANSFREQAPTGPNSLATITTTATAGIVLSGTTVTFSGPVTTTGGGPLNITNTSTLTLSVPVSLGGSFIQAGGGPVVLGSTVTTANQPISVTDIVTLTAPVTLNSGVIGGNILFSSTVNGGFALTCTAGTNAVSFGQAVGTVTPLTSLTATGNVINQDSTVTTVGAVSYTGALALGGDITTSGGAITIVGNVTRDTIPSVTLSSSGGSISVAGTVNGDIVGRNWTLNSGAGSTTITGVIGSSIPLDNVTITAGTISLEGIGGLSAGITGSLTLTSTGAINYLGSNYVANDQTHTAGTVFNMNAGTGMLFASTSGSIQFITGEIQLANQCDFLVTTNNSDVSFPSLVANSQENLYFSLGTGEASLGSISNVGNLFASAGLVSFNGTIGTSTIDITSLGSIVNGSGSVDVNVSTAMFLNALGGAIGSSTSPIQVSLPTYGVIGASSEAHFVGETVDSTLHCLPSNPSPQLVFNGVQIQCFGTPTPSVPTVIPLRDFFVPGIYSTEYNLGSDFYFMSDLVDKRYTQPRDAFLYYVKTHAEAPQPKERGFWENFRRFFTLRSRRKAGSVT